MRRLAALPSCVLVLAIGLRAQAPPPGPAAGRGSIAAEPLDFNDHAGWTSLFDGATLNGWDGNPAVWSVQNGVITASSTEERRVGTSYLIWSGGEVGDFELKLELRLEGDIHSGVAYRSWKDPNRAATLGPAAPSQPSAGRVAGTPPAAARGGGRAALPPPSIPADPRWTLYGPGLDYDADRRSAGNVEERGSARRILAPRGTIVRTEAGKRPRVIGSLGDPDMLLDVTKVDDWNQIHIVARGSRLTHIINGRVMAELIDDDSTFFTPRGLIALSIEAFGTGRVNVRNVWMKKP